MTRDIQHRRSSGGNLYSREERVGNPPARGSLIGIGATLVSARHSRLLRETKSDKPSAILPGTVEKIIKSPFPSEPEKAQIAVEGADHLYREIRIDNALTNETATK